MVVFKKPPLRKCFVIPLLVRVRGRFRLRFAPSVGFWLECFPCAGPQKTRLRPSKFALRLSETGGWENFWCLAVTALWRFSFVRSWIHMIWYGHKTRLERFPAQGHKKRVSGGQNLRFACTKRASDLLAFGEEVSVWLICVAALFFGVCRGGECVTALCRRRYIGVCRVICVK